MDETSQEMLIDEVRHYIQNLPLKKHRKNVPGVPQKVWEEIAKRLGKDENTCSRRWKTLRDDYVRAKKKGSIILPSSARAKLEWLSEIVHFDDPKMTVSVWYCNTDITSIFSPTNFGIKIQGQIPFYITKAREQEFS